MRICKVGFCSLFSAITLIWVISAIGDHGFTADANSASCSGDKNSKSPDDGKARTDVYGDPLPPGSLARLGSVRLCQSGEMVQALAFSPDGRILASAGRGGKVHLWNFITGKQLVSFSGHGYASVVALAFAPGGKLVVSGDNSGMVMLWKSDTGELIRELKGHKKGISALVFSEDAKLLASASGDMTVCVWETTTETRPRWFKEYNGIVTCVGFSQNGNILITTCKGEIRLDDLRVEKRTRIPFGDKEDCLAVTLNRNGKVLVSTCKNGTIRLFDLKTGKLVLTLPAGEEALSVGFSPDENLLAVGRSDGLEIWRVPTGKLVRKSNGIDEVSSLAFSPDAKMLVTGGRAGTIRIWEVATGKEVGSLQRHQRQVTCVSFSPDSKKLLSAAGDDCFWMWDTATGKAIRAYGENGVYSLAFSPDGSTIASAGWFLRLWDTANGKNIRTYSEGCQAVTFSPNGKVLAGGWGSKLRVWDLTRGLRVHDIRSNSFSINQLTFSRDSKLLLSVGIKDLGNPVNTVFVWNAITGKLVHSLKTKALSAALAHDGAILAVGMENHGIRLCEATTGEIIRDVGKNRVYSVAFSPDGLFIAGGDSEGVVSLWEVATGHLIASFRGHKNSVNALEFSPNCRLLASGSRDTTVLIWDAVRLFPSSPNLPKEMEPLWPQLGGPDSVRAWQIICALIGDPKRGIPFLDKHLPTAQKVDQNMLLRLMADLGSDSFAEREKASQELRKLGGTAAPGLRKLLTSSESPEVRRRAKRLLVEIASVELVEARALAVLERIGTVEATQVLKRLASGDRQAVRTKKAADSYQRIRETQTKM